LPAEVTELLNRFARGDKEAEQDLLPRIYGELRRIAAKQMRGERPDHTLQATALVHEAYCRLVEESRAEWENRAHFFAIAATVMRRILVDYARQRGASKRGAGRVVPPGEGLAVSADQCGLIAELDEALRTLEIRNARQAKVVELRYFAGLTEEEIAGLLGVTPRTVRRDWTVARAWLYGQLAG
jgi:RNA polymerase sigma factor (TIGR02999 family)